MSIADRLRVAAQLVIAEQLAPADEAVVDKVIAALDQQAMTEAAQKDYLHFAECYCEDNGDNDDLVNWDGDEHGDPTLKDVGDAMFDELQAWDGDGADVADYVIDVGRDMDIELTDDQLWRVFEKLGYECIGEYVAEHGYTDAVDKQITKLEDDLYDHVQEHKDDEKEKQWLIDQSYKW